jgi:transcriptional regulator with XRE-family HTH domain
MATSAVTLDSVVDSVVEGIVAGKPTLRQARVSKLLSANELGKIARVAASTVLDIEGGAKPRLSTIRKLAQALEMVPTDIDWPGDPLAEVEPPGGEDDPENEKAGDT